MESCHHLMKMGLKGISRIITRKVQRGQNGIREITWALSHNKGKLGESS